VPIWGAQIQRVPLCLAGEAVVTRVAIAIVDLGSTIGDVQTVAILDIDDVGARLTN
jgi:hypothetical protein